MIKKLIISRTDGIGDVVLTLPLAGLIKKLFPEVTVCFIGRSYTAPLISACEHVDEFINWDEVSEYTQSHKIEFFTSLAADAIVHVFPNKELARLAKQCKIPLRIGTSHRFYHWWLCNRLVAVGRKNSPLHEAQLNVLLLKPLGVGPQSCDELKTLMGITRVAKLEDSYSSLLDPKRFNLILHPKSKGSAREWGLENFSILIRILDRERFKIFISGTAEDTKQLETLCEQWGDEITDISGKMSLAQFMAFMGRADGVVAASTGPLHIAAALGKVTVGLYAPMRPIHPGRWAPLGPRAGFLVEDKKCQLCRHDLRCACIESIKPADVVAKISVLERLGSNGAISF